MNKNLKRKELTVEKDIKILKTFIGVYCKNIHNGGDFLCEDCRDHFEVLQGYLERTGIPFVLNHRLVRGLDYYTRTTFEIQTERLGAQNAVAAPTILLSALQWVWKE